VPLTESLICFSSKRIEMHPCPHCFYPMTLISDTSSRSNLKMRRLYCFNCDSAGMSSLSLPGLGASV
jgi:hypothetical protein